MVCRRPVQTGRQGSSANLAIVADCAARRPCSYPPPCCPATPPLPGCPHPATARGGFARIDQETTPYDRHRPKGQPPPQRVNAMHIALPKIPLRTGTLLVATCVLGLFLVGSQPQAALSPAPDGGLTPLGHLAADEESEVALLEAPPTLLPPPGIDANLIHRASGAIFPESIQHYERRDAQELGDDARRLTVTYTDEATHAVMFVHVQPSDQVPGAGLSDYFKGNVTVIEQQHPDAYLVQSIKKTISVAGQRKQGILGYLEFEEQGVLLGKLLYLFPWNDHYYLQVSSVFAAPAEDADLAPLIRASEGFIDGLQRSR